MTLKKCILALGVLCPLFSLGEMKCSDILRQQMPKFLWTSVSNHEVKLSNLEKKSASDNRHQEIIITDTHFPTSEFRGFRIQHGGRTFRLMNIGKASLLSDRKFIDQAIENVGSDWSNLSIKFSGKKLQAMSYLEQLQWLSHERILDMYKKKKGYLTDFDIGILILDRFHDKDIGNTWILVDETASELAKIPSAEETISRLVLTIQLTLDHYDFSIIPTQALDPISFFNDRKEVKSSDKVTNKTLPHLKRKGLGYIGYDDALKEYLNGRTAAEVTRYVKFDKHLPQELNEFLLLNLFEAALAEDIDVLVASVDPFTSQLFRSMYRFEYNEKASVFKETAIDKSSGLPLEHRIFLNLHSDEFKTLLESLRSGRNRLQMTPI